jgi:hypothetical protein
MDKKNAGSAGIGMLTAIGIAIAVQISWGFNQSVLWALWHGFLNWFYVLYRWIGPGVVPS